MATKLNHKTIRDESNKRKEKQQATEKKPSIIDKLGPEHGKHFSVFPKMLCSMHYWILDKQLKSRERELIFILYAFDMPEGVKVSQGYLQTVTGIPATKISTHTNEMARDNALECPICGSISPVLTITKVKRIIEKGKDENIYDLTPLENFLSHMQKHYNDDIEAYVEARERIQEFKKGLHVNNLPIRKEENIVPMLIFSVNGHSK